jgi:hypothetical protein
LSCNNGLSICDLIIHAPFSGNKIDPGPYNRVALNYLKFVPHSSHPCGRYVFGIPTVADLKDLDILIQPTARRNPASTTTD